MLLKDRLFEKLKPSKNQDPVPPLLFQMATSYWQAIYVAAKLGVANLLESGPKSSIQLVIATCPDASSLFGVLRALSSASVLSQTAENRFALARLEYALRSNCSWISSKHGNYSRRDSLQGVR